MVHTYILLHVQIIQYRVWEWDVWSQACLLTLNSMYQLSETKIAGCFSMWKLYEGVKLENGSTEGTDAHS